MTPEPYLAETVLAPLKADVAAIGKLGQGVDSIFPRSDYAGDMPPASTFDPFILVRFEDSPRTGNLTLQGIVRFIVHDLPGEWYWRIDPIVADLMRIYSDDNGLRAWFDDLIAPAWKHEIGLVSGPQVDDGWNRRIRWLDLTLWRTPR